MDGPGDTEVFAQMCFLRHFEERVDTLYRQGLIHGPVHLGLGQEAIAAGVASVLRPGDYSLGTYRGHAHVDAAGEVQIQPERDPACSAATASRAASAGARTVPVASLPRKSAIRTVPASGSAIRCGMS